MSSGCGCTRYQNERPKIAIMRSPTKSAGNFDALVTGASGSVFGGTSSLVCAVMLTSLRRKTKVAFYDNSNAGLVASNSAL
jgi:hypothetical protein